MRLKHLINSNFGGTYGKFPPKTREITQEDINAVNALLSPEQPKES